MDEVWKPVSGLNNRYEASNLGRIRYASSQRIAPCHMTSGYLRFGIVRNGKHTTASVHRSVALAFLGPCPEGKEVNHIDQDKTNNRIDNLEYITHAENVSKAYYKVLTNCPKGEDTYNSKLTQAQVDEIRQMLAAGVSQRKIATRFGVSSVSICKINTGKTWNTGMSAKRHSQ